LEFTTSVRANMSRMMAASPKSVLSMSVLLYGLLALSL